MTLGLVHIVLGSSTSRGVILLWRLSLCVSIQAQQLCKCVNSAPRLHLAGDEDDILHLS